MNSVDIKGATEGITKFLNILIRSGLKQIIDEVLGSKL
jgi:hypothetical protein